MTLKTPSAPCIPNLPLALFLLKLYADIVQDITIEIKIEWEKKQRKKERNLRLVSESMTLLTKIHCPFERTIKVDFRSPNINELF